MNKCFITKLPSSVDNDNLPVLGQLRIIWPKQSNLTDNASRAIMLSTIDNITVKVSGAHLTDSTLTSNLGNTKTITNGDGLVTLYVSNDADGVLTIDNKYSLKQLIFVLGGKEFVERAEYFDIEDIKYCTNLIELRAGKMPIYGDISAVSNLTNLKALQLFSTQVNGDISAVSNLTNLKALQLFSTQVNGDISAVSKLTNLDTLSINYTQISGDISAVSELTKLIILSLNDTQVSGKIDSLANLTKLSNLAGLRGLSLTGDMSKIPAGVNLIFQDDRKVTTDFTWTANGRKNATLLAISGNVPFDTASMDNMLVDQATCTVSPNATQPYHKIIAVKGTRTSASDAAVTAIQNMGVTITGVTKQA